MKVLCDVYRGHKYLHKYIQIYYDLKKTLADLDPRLINRYHQLVLEHMNSSESFSAGLKALPNKVSSFASTQAAWRFYKNENVGLPILQEPLTAAAHKGVDSHCLCVHDWSHMNYKHLNKTDTYAITHDKDVGYDLQASLILSDQNGRPLAPVAQQIVSDDGSFQLMEVVHLPCRSSPI